MVDISPTDLKLDAETAEKIRKLCQAGYQLFDNNDPKSALRRFYQAWTILPKPQTQWQEAGWVLTAMGDAYFSKADYNSGVESLLSALHCPKAFGNPGIHLRLAKCLFELERKDEAVQQLKLVVEHGGDQSLRKEDPKYLALLAPQITAVQ